VIGPNDPTYRKIDCLERIFNYSASAREESLSMALTSGTFDFVIPCDDRARVDLEALFRDPMVESKVKDLILKSLGQPEGYPVLQSRLSSLRLAEEAGLLVPVTLAQTNALEFPVVIKADHTSGGDGVRIARSRSEYENYLRKLSRRPSFSKVVKRWVLDSDRFYLFEALRWNATPITLQAFVKGLPANRVVFCWKGKVLAGISIVALETLWSTGPSAIVEVIENKQMDAAAQTIVERLGATGFLGFDFMLEEATLKAFLIEINPRATPTGHLSLGVGHDLCAAFAEVMTGRKAPARPKVESKRLVIFREGMPAGLPDDFYSDAPSEYPDLVRYWRQPPGTLHRLTQWLQNKFSRP
jgi:hypothetical protein